MNQTTYKSPNYKLADVTGRYVRAMPNKLFKVFETATCLRRSSMFYGKAGMGSTLREYVTDGLEIPAEVRAEAIKTQTTVSWGM